MSQSSRRLLSAVLCAAPLIGAGLFCSSAHASSNQGGIPGPESFTLSPVVQQQEQAQADSTTSQASADHEPIYLDAPAEDKPNIHGFFESPFKTSYTTPRGLVVFDHGVVWQPVVGLVLPLGFDLGPYITKPALVAGIWNSVAGSLGDPGVGGWEEMDVFVDIGATLFGKVKTDITFGDWNFPGSTAPPNKPKAEKNIDVKFVYDDSDIWGKDSGFSVSPYCDVFFAVAGSSTVVLGRQGSTGYVEIGIAPSYTYKGIANWPITLTMPIYCSVGPAGYWGEEISGGHHDGNFGVLSASLNGQVPLPFIPVKYGYWHADAGVSYYYLKNNNLLAAGTLISGNTDRNFVQGSVGIGVNF